MKVKNINLYICIGIFVLFSIGYFITINKVSYAFAYNEEDALYENKLNLIEKSAENYATNNSDLFKDKKSIYITIDDLVQKGYYPADDENGSVNDPRSDVKTLNDWKVRITQEKDAYQIKIISKN